MGTTRDELSSLELYSVEGSRPFLVGIDGQPGKERLTIHAARSCTTRHYAPSIRAKLRSKGHVVACKVVRHRERALERAQSLAGLLKLFPHDRFICDPTAAFARARGMVLFAEKLRTELGAGVDGLLWHGQHRSIYIVLNRDAFLGLRNVDRSALADVELFVHHALRETCGALASDYIHKVRFYFEPPPVATVPIDNGSVVRKPTRIGAMASRAAAALLGLGVATTASTDERDDALKASHRSKQEIQLRTRMGYSGKRVKAKGVLTVPLGYDSLPDNSGGSKAPAVSGTNAEIGLMGGSRDGQGTFLAEGAVTFPIGHQFGARIDGTAGVSNSAFFGGAAAHLFWRDPAYGLLGVAGGYSSVDPDGGINGPEGFGRLGAEGEIYLNDLTISGFAGGQFGNSEVKGGFAGRLDVEWYLLDNLMLSVGGEWNPERQGIGRFGVEYMPALAAVPGLSLFAEGAIGDDDYTRVFGGIRMYFGQSKTLKDRHRYDTFRTKLMSTNMGDTQNDNTMPEYGG